MKKIIKIAIILLVILVFIIALVVINKKSNKEYYITDHEMLYKDAIQYLIDNDPEENKGKEDYQIFISYDGFGITEKKDKKYIYMWILNESYYVENKTLQSGSGSSMFYKFTYEDGKITGYENPKDGSYYTKSIKKLCPDIIMRNKVLNYESKLSNEDNIKEHYSYLK